MSKLDKDSVIASFTKAYEASNGTSPSIEAKSGWYSVDGGKNIRLAQLAEMISDFGTASTKKASPENKDKLASSFSVKDFYTKQILDLHPNNRAPR